MAHITPENFESAVQCIRTFVEASLGAGGQVHHSSSKAAPSKRTADHLRRSKSTSYDIIETETDDLPTSYHEVRFSRVDPYFSFYTNSMVYSCWLCCNWLRCNRILENPERAFVGFSLCPNFDIPINHLLTCFKLGGEIGSTETAGFDGYVTHESGSNISVVGVGR